MCVGGQEREGFSLPKNWPQFTFYAILKLYLGHMFYFVFKIKSLSILLNEKYSLELCFGLSLLSGTRIGSRVLFCIDFIQ